MAVCWPVNIQTFIATTNDRVSGKRRRTINTIFWGTVGVICIETVCCVDWGRGWLCVCVCVHKGAWSKYGGCRRTPPDRPFRTYILCILENELEFMYVFMINSQIQWCMQFEFTENHVRFTRLDATRHTRMNTLLNELGLAECESVCGSVWLCGVARHGKAGRQAHCMAGELSRIQFIFNCVVCTQRSRQVYLCMSVTTAWWMNHEQMLNEHEAWLCMM